jgi:CPA2 family monovalent cation:H+ antiporter-2
MGYPVTTALTVSASLAQIGEFSFILVSLGVSLALLPDRGRDLVLAGAIISIMLNPMFFALLDRFIARSDARATQADAQATNDMAHAKATAREPLPETQLREHVVLVGHGRVGKVVSAALRQGGTPVLVIEDNQGLVEQLHKDGIEVILGNAAAPDMLQAANIVGARGLLVAIPDAFEGGQIVAKARALSASLPIIARAHSEEEIAHLRHHGANVVIMGEQEIAKAMIAQIGTGAVVA